MTHFLTIVILPKEVPNIRSEVEEVVSALLEPYDENKAVPEYETACYCVGREADHEIQKRADERFGTIDEMRKKFWQGRKEVLHPIQMGRLSDEEEKKAYEEYRASKRQDQKDWKEFLEPYDDFIEKEKKAHPKKDAAKPDCEECNGTGKRMTTSNPKGRWDWWVIGGRWTGWFKPEYDATKDERNIKVCDLCHGTGTRTKPVPLDPNWKPTPGECNGCNGKGKMVAWSLADFDGDIEVLKNIPTERLTGSGVYVTPDGEWHESGRVGWFATSYDEKIPEVWERIRDQIIAGYPDHLAVVVDCHV